MAGLISTISMIIGGIGIFFGFYTLSNSPETSLNIVTLTAVGIVGALAFVRHVIFHKSDAKRLGWETERPDWMFEVGFANLAFSITAFLAVFCHWGLKAQAAALIGYAIYLFQGALLHGYRHFTDDIKSPARLWRSFFASLLYVGMMTYFIIVSLVR